jgi:fluoride exporter
MGLTVVLAIAFGAGVGAVLRWWLGMLFNPIFPTLPLGTLAANLLGGLLMGLVVGAASHFRALPTETQLMIGTGFLGGLTTFSTFSAEATHLLLRQQYGWFAGHVAIHVIGSLAMTIAGMALIRTLLRA